MKQFYITILSMAIIASAFTLSAQRVVNIAASSDPTMPTDIFPVIMGDTTATGERADANTVYKLENGAVYVTTGRIVNKPDWDLQIEAEDLGDIANKPVISRIPNASGEYPDIMRPEGNVTLRNIWFVAGEKGPLEQHDWGKIRYMGDDTRIIADHCIFEKDRGGFFQIRGNRVKLYITNCVMRNGGNRRILQGNGRAVDARNTSLDTLVMKNCIAYNLQDRFFRSQGATEPHNYVEIDNCTAFNVAGRHGFIQLGRVLEAHITDNLFIDPIMLGSSPFYTDEQTQPDGDLHKVITLDTLYDDTSLAISNNNIFWNQEVMDYWASNDTVSAPGFLSDLVMENLGAAAGDAFFSEPLELNSVPGTILEYVTDLYANPAAEDMFDFIVEDELLAGTSFDSGNLFDFSTFDPCYDSNTMSATASTGGGSVGAVDGCASLTSIVDIDNTLSIQIYPNPSSEDFNVLFNIERAGDITMTVSDLSGRTLLRRVNQNLPVGHQQFIISANELSGPGIYFLTVQSGLGIMTQRIIVQ